MSPCCSLLLLFSGLLLCLLFGFFNAEVYSSVFFFEFSFEVTKVAPPDSSQWIYLFELHINNAQFFPTVS